MNIRKVTAVSCGVLLLVAIGADAGGIQRSNPMLWQPFVNVAGFYENDTDAEETFFDVTAGLRFAYTGFEQDFSAMGFASSRFHIDDNDRDFASSGGMLRFRNGAMERSILRGDLAFRRVEDIDMYGSEIAVGGVSPDSVLDAVTRSRRDILQAGISAGKNVTDKMDIEVGYRFDDVDYLDRSLQNIATHMVQVETARKVTDKTAGLLTIKGGMQDNESLDDQAYYYAAQLGIRTKHTDRVNLRIGAGAQWYDRPDDLDNETGFSFDGNAAWLATDKLVMQVGARNGIQLSPLYESNASQFSVFSIAARYQMKEHLGFSGNMAYRIDDYLDQVSSDTGDGMMDREDKGFAVRVRADYQKPLSPLKLYAELSHEITDSPLGDFDRTRLGAGMQYVF